MNDNNNLNMDEIAIMLNRLKIMKKNQVKASQAYYERNKEQIIKKKVNKIKTLNITDPEAYEKLRLKRKEYYQSRKLKDSDYLKNQYIQKKEKNMNMPPLELSLQL